MKKDAEKLKELIGRVAALGEIEYGGGYPLYPPAVSELISLCGGGTDFNYPAHIDAVKTKKIEALGEREIATYMTFIERGERFCDGHIASYLEDGTLLCLAKRLLELWSRQGFLRNLFRRS